MRYFHECLNTQLVPNTLEFPKKVLKSKRCCWNRIILSRLSQLVYTALSVSPCIKFKDETLKRCQQVKTLFQETALGA